MTPSDLSINRLDENDTVRAKIHGPTVKAYAQRMEAGDEFPPVAVVELPSGRLLLADGAHRVAAARRLKRETLPAHVRHGTEADALAIATHANTGHGRPFTAADRKRLLRLRLLNPDTREASNRTHAEAVGMTPAAVKKTRWRMGLDTQAAIADRLAAYLEHADGPQYLGDLAESTALDYDAAERVVMDDEQFTVAQGEDGRPCVELRQQSFLRQERERIRADRLALAYALAKSREACRPSLAVVASLLTVLGLKAERNPEQWLGLEDEHALDGLRSRVVDALAIALGENDPRLEALPGCRELAGLLGITARQLKDAAADLLEHAQ